MSRSAQEFSGASVSASLRTIAIPCTLAGGGDRPRVEHQVYELGLGKGFPATAGN
jgi:hypothetical protein